MIDSLVLLAQEGDKDAFGKIYDHFFDQIYRYVFFRVNADEVDDIVESVFIKAWVNLDKYEKRDFSFSSWLYKIAHNATIDHHRSHRKIEQIDENLKDESEEGAPQKLAEQGIMSAKVREAVNELKDPYKQVVSLKFLNGLSNAEIAEILGEREGNIRVLQFRALKELKKRLEEKGISYEVL
mgnify:CR=1 FL=1